MSCPDKTRNAVYLLSNCKETRHLMAGVMAQALPHLEVVSDGVNQNVLSAVSQVAGASFADQVLVIDISTSQSHVMPDDPVFDALRARNIPIILLVDYGDTARVEQWLRYGAIDYLYKPFSQLRLKVVVNNAIKLAQTARIAAEKKRLSHAVNPLQLAEMMQWPYPYWAKNTAEAVCVLQAPKGCGVLAYAHYVRAVLAMDAAEICYHHGALDAKCLSQLPEDGLVVIDLQSAPSAVEYEVLLQIIKERSLKVVLALPEGEGFANSAITCARITLPSLAEKADRIPLLAEFLLQQQFLQGLTGHRACYFSERANQLLQHYHWPGNLDELSRIAYQAALLSEQCQIDYHSVMAVLPSHFLQGNSAMFAPESAPMTASTRYLATLNGEGQVRSLRDLEGEAIRNALSHYSGHLSEVARRLGIGRSTLYRKLSELDISIGDVA